MIWFRIDKENGAVQPSNGVNVVRAAFSLGDHGGAAMKAGRFETGSAVYSRADQLLPGEQTRQQPVRCLTCPWAGFGWQLAGQACPRCDGRVTDQPGPLMGMRRNEP